MPDSTRAHAIQIVETVHRCRKRQEACPECEATVTQALQRLRRDAAIEALQKLYAHLSAMGTDTSEVRKALAEYRRPAKMVTP